MARVAQATQTASARTADDPGGAMSSDLGVSPVSMAESVGKDKVLPLPGWLVKVYFIFPVVLYVPDVIFNYYVYSHGIEAPDSNPIFQFAMPVLWGFLSVGVVGMAYLLSVLAPWHWGQGHRIQAFFCALGVLIATGITTWNSLAYRSVGFSEFPTDKWAYSIWPQLQANHMSLTMILVSIAPPFWGLFWALVQPTETGRSLRQLQESHAERLLRMQQDAELKRIKAETNAKIRDAQLKGWASNAKAAREQAKVLFAQKDAEDQAALQAEMADDEIATDEQQANDTVAAPTGTEPGEGPNVLHYPTFAPASGRGQSGDRAGAIYNHAASATPSAHTAPAAGRAPVSQPMMLADVHNGAGMPSSDVAATLAPRTPPVIGQGIQAFFPADATDLDGMTGTTGPRPAVRRPGDSTFLRTMNEPPMGRVETAMHEAMRQLNPTGKNKVPARDLVALVAEKLNVDEATAKTAINRVREMRRNNRG